MWLCERWIVIHSRPQLESFSFVCLLSPHCLLFLPAPIYVDLPHLPASLPRLSPTDSLLRSDPPPFLSHPKFGVASPFRARALSLFLGRRFPPPSKAATTQVEFVYLTFPVILPLPLIPHSLTQTQLSLSPSPLRTLSICYGYCKL